MKNDLNTIHEYRIDSESEVKAFIEEEKKKAIEEGYILSAYSASLKEKKDRKTKDIIDSGFLVRIKKTFNEFWEV